MSDLEKELKNLLNEMKEIKENQKIIDERMSKIEHAIDHIQSDIYMDDDFDFEIVCPYCENEFVIEADESESHIECPKCKNIIELDWTGNIDEDECGGHCHGCHGCGDFDEDDDM